MSSTSPGQNLTTTENPAISRSPRIAFLILFMAMTSVGSIFIFVAVIQHRKHKTAQNRLIANISIACILDCFLNMTLVLGALIADDWVYGDFMCKTNTALMSFVASEFMLMVMSFSVDRYLALRFYLKYEAWLKPYRLNLYIASSWILALAFSAPFLTDVATSTFHSQLHLCSATEGTSTLFLWSTLLASFLLPFLVTVVFHVMVIHLSCHLRDSKRVEMTQQTYTQIDKDASSCPPVTLSHPSCYTRILFIMWLVLVVPSVITYYVKHFGDEEQTEDFPWEADAVFLWLRFFFPAIFPIVTFYCKKELWQTTKECVLCRRNNSVIDMEVIGVSSVTSFKLENAPPSLEELPNPKAREKEKEKEKDKEKVDATNNALTFNVPVLFATSTGICIEDPCLDESYEPHVLSEEDAEKVFKGKKLDVTYGQEWFEELVGDTSDYDSSYEIDQYSTSQPVSTRNVTGTLHRTRSLSDPEITKYVSPRSNKGNNSQVVLSNSNTMGADSGLDLSGTAGSKTGRLMKQAATSDPNKSNSGNIPPNRSSQQAQNDHNSSLPDSANELKRIKHRKKDRKDRKEDGEDCTKEQTNQSNNIATTREDDKLHGRHPPTRLEPLKDIDPPGKTKRKKQRLKENNISPTTKGDASTSSSGAPVTSNPNHAKSSLSTPVVPSPQPGVRIHTGAGTT